MTPNEEAARALARNIVNQLFDEADVPAETRQSINDRCDEFVANLVVDFVVDIVAASLPCKGTLVWHDVEPDQVVLECSFCDYVHVGSGVRLDLRHAQCPVVRP